MKIGVCHGFDDYKAVAFAAKCGADHYEPPFREFVSADDEKVNMFISALKEAKIPCISACNFIIGDLALTGENVDYPAISEYLDKGFENAKKIGLKKVVFGSGKARSCPDGFSPDKAYSQVVKFLSDFAAPKAKKAGVIIVIEPLRFNESTMIHKVSEGVKLADDSGCDNVFGLADLYHVCGNGDDIDGIADFVGKVRHAHIANGETRHYPLPGDVDEMMAIYKRFFAALNKAGCDTCTIEARTDDFYNELPQTLKLLKELVK